MRRFRLALPLGLAVALALTAASARPAASPVLTITALKASLVRTGSSSWASWGVHLRPTVCFRTAAAANNAYPSSVTIGHYLVQKARWWNARTVVDHPPWLVPFGETWKGRCGPATFDDPIPSDHYGVESLGNPLGCYAVSLAIRVGSSTARRRAIVTCKPRFGP